MKAWRPAGGRRTSWRRVGWTVLAAMVVVGGLVALLLTAPFLRVQTVDYRTDAARMAALKAAAPVTKGEPLVQVDTTAIRDDALSTRLFSTVTVSRHWPSTIVVDATPRVAAVGVTGPGSSGVTIVDPTGVPFETLSSAPKGVPVATASAPADPTALRSLATVLGGLPPDLRRSVADVTMDASGVIRMTVGKVAVTWGDATDSRLKTAVVRDLVDRAGVARIDVSAPMAPVTSTHREASTWTPGAAASTGPSGSPAGSPTARESAAPERPGGFPTGTPTATPEGTATAP